MVLGQVMNVFGAIVTLAVVGVVVTSPNTASIIQAWGGAFSGGISAALGNTPAQH